MGSAWLVLGMDAAAEQTGLERQSVSRTNPITTLEGPGEQSCLAGLYRTSVAWVFKLRDGFGEAERV